MDFTWRLKTWGKKEIFLWGGGGAEGGGQVKSKPLTLTASALSRSLSLPQGFARLGGFTWNGRRSPPPSPHLPQCPLFLVSAVGEGGGGGLFYDKMSLKPAWRAIKHIDVASQDAFCLYKKRNLKGGGGVVVLFISLKVMDFTHMVAHTHKWRFYGGWCGEPVDKNMNMYVHIYPGNDYLLEHSLIVFHNSFCTYSPFIEFKQTH